jgi:chloramphenicol 3-O-phosphotransferase
MTASGVEPTLLYLYGPPASGKLTVATSLAELTGFSLFHNHLTVDAVSCVLPFGSKPYIEILHRLRLDVFQTAARAGISLIFTNSSAWSGPDPRSRFAAFAAAARRLVEAEGGRTVFVKLTAPLAVLEERADRESRRRLGKLTDIARLREQVAGLDQSKLHPDDLEVDTSTASAAEAALYIQDALARR